MTLADLIDLEAQLARDRDADPASLEARDRALAADSHSLRRDRTALLGRWLEALRAGDPGGLHPGQLVDSALGLLRASLLVAGLLLGWGAATAALRYDGTTPVNVWDVLLLFVGVQLVLLLLLLGSFLLPAAAVGRPAWLGPVRGALAGLYPRLAARALAAGGPRLDEWRGLWHRLRSRRSLYHRLEPWLLLGLTQSFGVAFNVGALLACARVVVFSDVAFAWSTTLLQLDAGRFLGLTRGLALPWGWLWPDAVPTRELVAATLYSRLEGAYVLSGAGRAARPELVGGWWPFLTAALACYGLLPRLVTLAVARLRAGALLARLPLDDAEVSRVVRRLTEPHVETRSPHPEGPAPPPGLPSPPQAPPVDAGPCAVVLWRDVAPGPALEAAVVGQTGCAVEAVHAAGGRDDAGAEDRWSALPGGGPVVVVAEAWEAPDRGALRLLRQLRRAAGPGRHLRVLLVEADDGLLRAPAEDQVRIWREVTDRLADPYLSVEPLRGTP